MNVNRVTRRGTRATERPRKAAANRADFVFYSSALTAVAPAGKKLP
jgi:hypothetical protein